MWRKNRKTKRCETFLRLKAREARGRFVADGLEESGGAVPRCGERPREVGEALRRELAQPLRVDAPFEPRGLAERLISDAI